MIEKEDMTKSEYSGNAWRKLLAEQARMNGRLFFKIAFDILGNAESAEDVCQKAFTKAWEQRKTIRNAVTLKSWLARVIVNEALQDIRRNIITKRVLENYSALNTEKPNSDDKAGIRETIKDALEKLSEPVRTIVVLRSIQGMSGNDVAALLGCSASEVSRRFYEGLEILRRVFNIPSENKDI